MALKYDVTRFESTHAAAHLQVTARAYASYPEHARPRTDAAFHARLHGDSNPAGPALVAVARDGGQEVGMISAIPARFRARDGTPLIGYQPGALVVDPVLRTRGITSIGFKLIKAIVEASAAQPDAFVYAYPNERSRGIAERVGFRPVQTVPTHLFPGVRLTGAIGATLRGHGGGRWEVAKIADAAELRSIIPADAACDATGFVRDRANFEWRFGGAAAGRYTLVACRAADPRDSFAVACAEHRMAGFPFTVLVDGYPGAFLRHFDVAVRAASVSAGRAGPRVVYVSTNLPALGLARRYPLGIPVPKRFHPRPINLLFHPTPRMGAPDELAAALAMTGDWFGF